MYFANKNKLLILIAACSMIVQSCGDSIFDNSETYYIEYESREWKTNTLLYQDFPMIDENLEVESFTLENEDEGFYATINFQNSTTYNEIGYQFIQQNFESSKGNRLYLKLAAQMPYQGTMFHLRFNDLLVKWNVLTHKIISVDSDFGNKDNYDYYTGNEGKTISTLSFHDTLLINNTEYLDVIEFNFMDYQEYWTDSTIVELSYAKNIGLLRYTLNNGSIFLRQSQ